MYIVQKYDFKNFLSTLVKIVMFTITKLTFQQLFNVKKLAIEKGL